MTKLHYLIIKFVFKDICRNFVTNDPASNTLALVPVSLQVKDIPEDELLSDSAKVSITQYHFFSPFI
jgi:hypothetical protein